MIRDILSSSNIAFWWSEFLKNSDLSMSGIQWCHWLALQSQIMSQHCFTIPNGDLEMPALFTKVYCILHGVSHNFESGLLHPACCILRLQDWSSVSILM